MNVLDVNVVLAAHRPDHALHQPALRHMQDMAEGDGFSVPDLVAGSFVRLATSRVVYSKPTPLEPAFAYLASLRLQRAYVPVAPGARHVEILERLCRTYDATGDLVPDAQLAAIAIENGAGVSSFDHDFARFRELRWTRPED